MKTKVIFFLIIFFGIFGLAESSWAACSWSGNTGTVALPYAASDVQACVNDSAGKTGAVIIQIPNSNTTWNSGIAVDMSSGWNSVTGLTIKGQNNCTTASKTMTTPGFANESFNYPTSCPTKIANIYVKYIGNGTKGFRLSNLELSGTSVNANAFEIIGNGKAWRFDNIFFNGLSASSRLITLFYPASDTTYGVIDHCYTNNPGALFFMVEDTGSQYSTGGNYSWMTPVGLGGPNAVYFENNYFYTTTWNSLPISDSNGAGRFVFRHNYFYSTWLGAHDAIVGGARGVRKWEIYNNYWDETNGNAFTWYGRSGVGVFFNNIINDPNIAVNQGGFVFDIERAYHGTSDPWANLCGTTSGKACLNWTGAVQSCSSDADCGGVTGACVNIDGSTSNPNGLPCRDQPGYDQAADGSMTKAPFLLWNNYYNGGTGGFIPKGNYGTTYVRSGYEYCNSATTMPLSCNGVTTNYTPYTYPHPLVSGSTPPSDTTPPAAPQGLSVQ